MASKPNIGSNTEVAKLLVFNGSSEKVSDFIIACKLYIRMRMREEIVEKTAKVAELKRIK